MPAWGLGAHYRHEALLQLLIDAPQLIVPSDMIGREAESGEHGD
jgi:hypothetical protein